MVKGVYLSAAAHETDNPTKCGGSCGENVHCKAYMDIVERRLRELGVPVKRGGQSLTGNNALKTRVAEANAWKECGVYYAGHTNAGGGRYSATFHWPNPASKATAEIIHKHRKCVPTHVLKTNITWYEMRKTKMVCVYDELFFHDNKEDCYWFHNGGMELMAEETVAALCEIVGATYKAPVVAKPETEKIYRVQVGAYKNLTNAKGMQTKLKNAGFTGIIVESDAE